MEKYYFTVTRIKNTNLEIKLDK